MYCTREVLPCCGYSGKQVAGPPRHTGAFVLQAYARQILVWHTLFGHAHNSPGHCTAPHCAKGPASYTDEGTAVEERYHAVATVANRWFVLLDTPVFTCLRCDSNTEGSCAL
eukprot:scaffold18176_cov20-Tisochrysis_lutea.AAC.1